MCVAAAGGTPSVDVACVLPKAGRLHAAGYLTARPSCHPPGRQSVRVHCQRNYYCCCCRSCCRRDQEPTCALCRKPGAVRHGCTTHSVQCGRRRHSARRSCCRRLRSPQRRTPRHRFLFPPAPRAHARIQSPCCAHSFARGIAQTCAAKPHRAQRAQSCAASAPAAAAALHLHSAVDAWVDYVAAEILIQEVENARFGGLKGCGPCHSHDLRAESATATAAATVAVT